MRYLYIFSIISIIILGAIFRLGFPDSYLFGGDEDDIACAALGFVEGGHIPLKGTTKGICTIRTIDVLLYLIMQYIRDPRAIILLVIGVPNTIAIVLLFLFCHRFINKGTALLASALFSFSNWAILYSKNLWGVDILQFFSILIFYLLALGINKPRHRWIILILFLLPFLPNLHLTSFSIFISVFLILFIYYLKLDFRAGALLVVLIMTSVMNNTLLGWLGLERKIITKVFSLDAFFTTVNLITRGEWYYGYFNIAPRYPVLEIINGVVLKSLFIFGCVYILKRVVGDWKSRCFSGYFIVGIWYFVFISTFGFTSLTPYSHYFMAVLPGLFIITSIGFFKIIDCVSGRERIENWELFLLSSIFLLWEPRIAIPTILIMLLIRSKYIFRKVINYSLYSYITFIIFFQVFSNFQLFTKLEEIGNVPLWPGAILGPKIRAVEYIVKDAYLRYKQTGDKSYYSIINDDGYNYLFRYITPKDEEFLTKNKLDKGYHYKIISDTARSISVEEIGNYVHHERIGPVLVVLEKIGG